jgi:hypothetical protein
VNSVKDRAPPTHLLPGVNSVKDRASPTHLLPGVNSVNYNNIIIKTVT